MGGALTIWGSPYLAGTRGWLGGADMPQSMNSWLRLLGLKGWDMIGTYYILLCHMRARRDDDLDYTEKLPELGSKSFSDIRDANSYTFASMAENPHRDTLQKSPLASQT